MARLLAPGVLFWAGRGRAVSPLGLAVAGWCGKTYSPRDAPGCPDATLLPVISQPPAGLPGLVPLGEAVAFGRQREGVFSVPGDLGSVLAGPPRSVGRGNSRGGTIGLPS